PWTEDEEQELLRQFDDKIDVEEIAAKHENDLYAAMRWLYERQPQIEEKLARGHLEEGTTVLYDLSSTYYEWSHCSFAE
ncbi:MAG: hypothetical protein PHG55_04970, partial [Verrucomicrobiota bacterium]|nr:hypothetical protein [Verrucomicrobiota bacterium]